MLLELVIFFTIASALLTGMAMLPGALRAEAWAGIPLGLVGLAAAGWLTSLLTGDALAGTILPVLGLGAMVEARRQFPHWSMLAALLFALLTLASGTYLLYAAMQPFLDRLGPIVIVASFGLLILEIAALGLSLYYLFEILDVFSRRDRQTHQADPAYLPKVAIQVPCYNEPVEVMRETLGALAKLDYPEYLVQVVDNNTQDPARWRPLEDLCRELGPRFVFIHLEPWPGYKAGALNEATRRLPPDVEILGIVDADYVVKPGWLKATVGHFADRSVAFVQTPQHYRDWTDSGYLRGLFYSYRYFFDITMPARAHRNAIIFAGTMGLIRRKALEEIGGWNEQCITEDADASLRMLGRGYVGVFEPTVWGSGLMPLSFDGLKKQRFRWALGGIQILRQQWRELVPFPAHQLRLTTQQRLQYLFGFLHWFGDLLTVGFTVLLLLTAVATAMHHRLPVRELTGAVLVVPLAFLTTGVLRGLWALRTAERASWGDAIRALAIWFALSWVVTLAVVRGLFSKEAAFLRTPKRREGGNRLSAAIRASIMESILAVLALMGAILMLVQAPALATAILAGMLLFEAAVFWSAPWASLAAEGITLTPLRRSYLESAQSSGDRPSGLAHAVAVPGAMALAVAVILAFVALASPPATTPSGERETADIPKIGEITKHHEKLPLTAPSPRASPTGSPGASPSATPQQQQ